MKNLGIKTKKFVRKITAIASAALMAGVSMGVAAANLSNLSGTFINSNGEFDAYVVVGTQGAAENPVGFAKDVAGSVVVAAAFAQQAKTTASTSGSAVLSRTTAAGALNDSYLGIMGSVPTSANKVWTASSTGFSWLTNQTVQNLTADIANATAVLTASIGKFGLSADNKYSLVDGALIYNLTFNNKHTETSGNKVVGNNTKNIPFPDGNMYQITNWTASGAGKAQINITLGDFTEVAATMGSVYNVGSTGATFEITAHSADPAALKIKVMKDGTQLYHDWVSTGEEIYSDSNMVLNLVKYYTPGGVVDATIEWTTSNLKLVNQEINSKWPNWTIYMTADTVSTDKGITSIAWVYRLDSTLLVAPGTVVPMLDNLFNVTFSDLTINSTDKKERTITVREAVSSAKDIHFVDENGTTRSVDINMISSSFDSGNATNINSWIDGLSFRAICWADSGVAKVNLTRTGYETVVVTNGSPFKLNNTLGNVSGYDLTANMTVIASGADLCSLAGYNLTILNFTSAAGHPVNDSVVYKLVGHDTYAWGNVSSSGVNGTLTFTEDNSKKIIVDYENGNFKSGSIESVKNNLLLSGEVYYSLYGTKVVRTSSEIVMYYPEAPRHGIVSVGSSGETTYTLNSGDYNSELDVTLKSSAGESVQIKKIDVGLAKLDSEVKAMESTLSKPIVLVGGSAVNSVVKDLVDAGKVSFASLADNKALVQLVDNAFNSKAALVIAGWTGDDTRLAAQAVASEVLGNNLGLLSGSSVVLNIGGETVNDVTVV